MSGKADAALETLKLAIHGVAAPFSCEGTCVPKKAVTFVFKNRDRFKVVRAKDDSDQLKRLDLLIQHCKPAPFGEGKKTRYNRTVRDALQLKAESGGFSIDGFDPESAGILDQIHEELVPHDPNPISAELYSVNVYTTGGHFAPHKDTPRGNDMFGTLVVCLPSQFRNGALVLSHRGVVKKYDWGPAIQKQETPNQLHWVAFFGDVDHQIERLWGGARVTLTYLLRRGEGAAPPRDAAEDIAPRIQEAWQALLADSSLLPNGGILGYPCHHLYHQDARFQAKQSALDRQFATMLKGRDHLVAVASLQAGLKVTFTPYMFENCADETWQLKRFPTAQERAKLGRQVDSSRLERALPILGSSEEHGNFGVTWLENPPTSDGTSKSNANRNPDLPAAAHLHSCEYCPWGYFGNEGSEVDLYTFAALHIDIPRIGRGPRAAAKSPTRTSVKRQSSPRKRKAKQE